MALQAGLMFISRIKGLPFSTLAEYMMIIKLH
jgi:hypothetical protein